MDHILGFFKRIPYSREALENLARFRSLPRHQFAVIKVGGEVLAESIDDVARDITYLNSLGLFPAIVFGWGNTVSRQLEDMGILADFDDDGDRRTDARAMHVISKVARETLTDLYNRVYGNVPDGAMEPFFSGVPKAEPTNLVGIVNSVDTDRIKGMIACGYSPMIPSCMEIDIEGQVVRGNVNADTAAKELVLALKPAKYLNVTPKGGILGTDGKIISEIGVVENYDELIEAGVISEGALTKVRRAKELVLARKSDLESPGKLVVEIVSAANMLPELFTSKGAGTYISLGYVLERHGSFEGLDQERLQALAGSSIGKHFVGGYFTDPILALYLEQEYHGTLVVKDLHGIPYMCKFLVDAEHRGNGLGGKMYKRAIDEHGKLMWRARPDNLFNPKYFEWCDRAEKGEKWNVFSKGLTEAEWGYAKECTRELPITME